MRDVPEIELGKIAPRAPVHLRIHAGANAARANTRKRRPEQGILFTMATLEATVADVYG